MIGLSVTVLVLNVGPNLAFGFWIGLCYNISSRRGGLFEVFSHVMFMMHIHFNYYDLSL
jgi:hypothetical protein